MLSAIGTSRYLMSSLADAMGTVWQLKALVRIKCPPLAPISRLVVTNIR